MLPWDIEDDSCADESEATLACREAEKEAKLTDQDYLPEDLLFDDLED